MAVKDNLNDILGKINGAALRTARDPSQIKLVAVTKTQPMEKIQEFMKAAEETSLPIILGENYVQEFREKSAALPRNTEAHLIGPLQTNKVKDAITLFDLIESVHSLKTLNEIQKRAKALSMIQKILLQVNISNDPSKSGFKPSEISNISPEEYPNIKFSGLMTITAFYDEPELARPDFKALKVLSNQHIHLGPELSMGMSADYEIAIEEGATMVRIGTSLFGSR